MTDRTPLSESESFRKIGVAAVPQDELLIRAEAAMTASRQRRMNGDTASTIESAASPSARQPRGKPATLYALLAAAGALIAFPCYLYLSAPEGLAVGVNGEVVGLFNEARAQLQGRAFWAQQLRVAEAALRSERQAPQRDAEWRAELASFATSASAIALEFPDSPPPSPGEAKAQALREEADRIESAETDAHWASLIEGWRLKKIALLERLLPVIAAKAR